MSRWGTMLRYVCCKRLAQVDFDGKPDQSTLDRIQLGPCPLCAGLTGAPELDLGEPEREPEHCDPDLPELVGSVKQVSWALTIRREKLLSLDKHLRDWALLIERHSDPERAARGRANRQQAIEAGERLRNVRESWWWIDRKDASISDLLEAVR